MNIKKSTFVSLLSLLLFQNTAMAQIIWFDPIDLSVKWGGSTWLPLLAAIAAVALVSFGIYSLAKLIGVREKAAQAFGIITGIFGAGVILICTSFTGGGFLFAWPAVLGAAAVTLIVGLVILGVWAFCKKVLGTSDEVAENAAAITGSIVAGASIGAGIGAAIGSVVPGVGTAVGAAVGAVVGAVAGAVAGVVGAIFDWW